MRRALGAACAIAAMLAVFACSSSSSHPPVQSGCTGAGCGGGSGGGGSSSSGGGRGSDGSAGDDGSSTGPCGLPSNASQCLLCVAQRTSCCTDLQSCVTNATCEAMLGCVNACGGGSSCVNSCCQTYPAQCGTYQHITQCQQICQPCVESGVGDACGGLSSYPCAANLTCNGSWCTRTCSTDADCAGIGPGGGNYLGFTSSCIHTSGGNTCAPGCKAAPDCSGFAGTTCVVATDVAGGNVFVCGALSDASTE